MTFMDIDCSREQLEAMTVWMKSDSGKLFWKIINEMRNNALEAGLPRINPSDENPISKVLASVRATGSVDLFDTLFTIGRDAELYLSESIET